MNRCRKGRFRSLPDPFRRFGLANNGSDNVWREADSLGSLLRQLRREQGLTQSGLGITVGLPQHTVSRNENAFTYNMTVDTLSRHVSGLGLCLGAIDSITGLPPLELITADDGSCLLGTQLRGLRRRRGLTQTAFSAIAGWPQGVVSRVERTAGSGLRVETLQTFLSATHHVLGFLKSGLVIQPVAAAGCNPEGASQCRPRSRPVTISSSKLSTKRRFVPIEFLKDSGQDVSMVRPRTRNECSAVPRPCPFISCKYHMYLDVHPKTGSVKLNFPHLAPEEMPPGASCALDMAERRPVTVQELGVLMNLTAERIREMVGAGLLRLDAGDITQHDALAVAVDDY